MSSVVAALQRALAAEYEAVFGYGVLGPHLFSPSSARARTCQTAHEQLRDTAEALLTARRQQLDPPLADYPDLYPVRSSDAAERLALRLEVQAAAAWRAAFAAAVGASPLDTDARERSQAALTASALRAMSWRQAAGHAFPTVPFPGI